ncbi:MAG: HD domain-containing protein [Candidatus Aureabacteria bacterium]|nr:HD domain-containing protein [Candidatus Auribacterota bacterium]
MHDRDTLKDKLPAERLAALDRIELIVKQIVTAGSQVALYADDHPAVREYAERAYSTMGEILTGSESFTVSAREGMLLYENIPLYRLSVCARKFTDLFEAKKIHGMVVKRGLQLDELLKFIAVLMASPEKFQGRDEINRELIRRGVRHIEVMQLSKEDEETALARQPRIVYQDAVQLMRQVARSIMMGRAIAMGEVDSLIGEISRMIAKEPRAVLALTMIKDYDEPTFTHSVNVCILATALASLFIKDAGRLRQLCQAALLHDVGKILIPPEIISKTTGLDEMEWAVVRRHPAEGARMLEETGGVGPLSAVIAFEHHMRYDMSGYPRSQAIRRPHPMSLLVQIVDVYEALTAERPYRMPISPEDAMSEIASGAGTVFEPSLLKEFFSMMGLLASRPEIQ